MRTYKIQRTKSEAPVIAVFAVFSLIVSLAFFPIILWLSFLVFPVMAIAFLLFRKTQLGVFGKKCFLIVDEEGIRYCFHLMQQARLLRWDQVDKVNFQMYEINFKLKESGQVISMQTSYLEDPSEADELRADISRYAENS
jgi:fatty acid desaturase